MTEEIKEKLDLLKYCVEKNEYLEVSNMKEWKPLLNYITNLQKENENYKSRNEKAVEYIKTIANADKSVRSTIAKMILVDYKNLLNILQGGDE